METYKGPATPRLNSVSGLTLLSDQFSDRLNCHHQRDQYEGGVHPFRFFPGAVWERLARGRFWPPAVRASGAGWEAASFTTTIECSATSGLGTLDGF